AINTSMALFHIYNKNLKTQTPTQAGSAEQTCYDDTAQIPTHANDIKLKDDNKAGKLIAGDN
ncbi:hypothetical protein, partial [Pseudomonas syringae group genomosp. 7]